jgi:CDP-glycerol glycerophosphotransferase (TagB/SpsB family)
MMGHKCIHCSRAIVSDFVVCLTCRKKKRQWAKRNRARVNKTDRAWRQKNPSKVRASKSRYRKSHLEQVRKQIKELYKKNKKRYMRNRYRSWLQSKYGLTKEQFYDILREQKGECAICRKQQRCGKRNKLYVDHDHKTNRLRGLVCFKCNVLLGMAQDEIRILKKAIAYLRRKE